MNRDSDAPGKNPARAVPETKLCNGLRPDTSLLQIGVLAAQGEVQVEWGVGVGRLCSTLRGSCWSTRRCCSGWAHNSPACTATDLVSFIISFLVLVTLVLGAVDLVVLLSVASAIWRPSPSS